MELATPRRDAAIEQTVTFDERTGVLAIGWSARPAVNIGSSLAYKLSAADAKQLAAALTAFASVATSTPTP